MRDYIKRMYESLQNNDSYQFDEIYFGIVNGNIETGVSDIVPICVMSIHDFANKIEPHQQRKIAKITFHICNQNDLEKGLMELIKGIKRIYNESLIDQEKKLKSFFSYEEIMEEFLGMFVCEYDEENMILLANLLNKDDCREFKDKLIEILEEDMEYQEEDFRRKGSVLIDYIN